VGAGRWAAAAAAAGLTSTGQGSQGAAARWCQPHCQALLLLPLAPPGETIAECAVREVMEETSVSRGAGALPVQQASMQGMLACGRAGHSAGGHGACRCRTGRGPPLAASPAPGAAEGFVAAAFARPTPPSVIPFMRALWQLLSHRNTQPIRRLACKWQPTPSVAGPSAAPSLAAPPWPGRGRRWCCSG
jgi:hypothetical protein